MSGIGLACHIRHREMMKARSEAANLRAENDEKAVGFKDDQ